MKSRDLIIKTARRLDKFNLDELIVVSELDEKEVTEILSNLIKQQIILKNNNTYFFNTKKVKKCIFRNTFYFNFYNFRNTLIIN